MGTHGASGPGLATLSVDPIGAGDSHASPGPDAPCVRAARMPTRHGSRGRASPPRDRPVSAPSQPALSSPPCSPRRHFVPRCAHGVGTARHTCYIWPSSLAFAFHATLMTQQLALLDRVRCERKIARPQRPYAQRTSKLSRHSHTLLELHDAGASLGEMQHYLRAIATPSVSVARSTISRYLHKLRS